ncbi:hypothetical protein CDL12_02787 [Handroanthus impetiginosus]|uniref:Putative plant transposon protein domain-containing protein n=1 Tax=Handroanthus impetiginosus TaxID=429701 RepID=A0A2G9I401_9LAMI|nr:hypothetical protein CDL12_02787 [Handroanthus impetiginosus]
MQTSRTKKASKPSETPVEEDATPLTTVPPPLLINWKQNSSYSFSSGEPSAPPPVGMGASGIKHCEGSSSKALSKTLFEDQRDSPETSGSDTESENVNEMANLPTENENTTTWNSPYLRPHPFKPRVTHLLLHLPRLLTGSSRLCPMPQNFQISPQKTRYQTNFSFRKLNQGRGILFSSFPVSIVVEWIRALHWNKLMAVNEVCYPYLVKLFYSNLMIVSDDSDNVCLKSFVLGKEFTLTIAHVNSLFDLPDEGSKFFGFGEWNTPEYTLADLRHIFWEGRAYPFSGGKTFNNMFVDHFFLHKLILCTLLSGTTTSGGHTTDINTVSMYLTYMAVHGRPVNLGFIILKYIAYSALHTSKNLPYGMLLTLVFKKEHVSLPPSWMEPPKERRTIDLNNLKKMRIHYSETDGWYRGVKKDSKAETIEVSSSTDAPPRKCTRGSTSVVPYPSPDILLLQDSLASFHTKIDSQSSTILELKNQIKRLCRKLRKKSLS